MPDTTVDFMAELAACAADLRRFARGLLRDAAGADDLVQDCLERALERRHLWRGGASLRPWLFRIMRNLHANQRRQERRRPSHQAIDEALHLPGPEDAHAGRLELRELEAALDLLPADQREVVLLVALSGMSYQECADALELPIGTVMSRLSRGRERLRVLLEGESRPRLRRVQ